MKVDLEQGTREWKLLRRTKITGTDASIIMGLNKWSTPYQLWRQKQGYTEVRTNFRMRMGSSLECQVRSIIEKQDECTYTPAVHVSDKRGWMMCSTEGDSDDGTRILEIKCGEGAYRLFQEGIVPAYYNAQMQHNMFVSGASEAKYVAAVLEDGILMTPSTIVERDDNYIKKMIKAEKNWYMQHVVDCIPPELQDGEPLYLDDAESIEIADKWLSAHVQCKEWRELEKTYREQLLELATNRDIIVEDRVACRLTGNGTWRVTQHKR